MDLNTRGRYAVMAMADLARHGADGSLSLAGIAERQHLSASYLEQIFLQLRRAGLVDSVRGRTGGYRLSRSADGITVADVMCAVEEKTRMTRCMGDDTVGCLGPDRCLTHGLWQALGEEIHGFLDQVTLQDVIDGIPLAKRRFAALPAEARLTMVPSVAVILGRARR